MVPEMILFDYGQTLIHERIFDPVLGSQAILDAAVRNPEGITAAQLVQLAEEVNRDILRSFGAPSRHYQPLEIPGLSVTRYEWEYFGLEFDLPPEELEWIYWSNATPAEAAPGARKLLDFLASRGIATGVVSNMMNSGTVLRRRLQRLLPGHPFQFVLSSCDYVFRKPHPRIFDLALKLAKCPAESILFCGDNLRCDMEGAHNAGMDCFWYTKYLRARPAGPIPDYVTELRDWQELIDLLMLCD